MYIYETKYLANFQFCVQIWKKKKTVGKDKKQIVYYSCKTQQNLLGHESKIP